MKGENIRSYLLLIVSLAPTLNAVVSVSNNNSNSSSSGGGLSQL